VVDDLLDSGGDQLAGDRSDLSKALVASQLVSAKPANRFHPQATRGDEVA
jgi:hypothetical protein